MSVEAKKIRAYTLDELRAKGPPKLFTNTTAAWKAIFVKWWEESEDGPQRPLYPGQPETLLIAMQSYGFMLLGQEAQYASQQRWLAHADGQHIDLGAANNSTFRLKAQSAKLTLKFTLSEVRLGASIIPAGTQIEAGDDLIFETDDDLVILATELEGQVGATAYQPGTAHNEVEIGAVDQVIGFEGFDVSVTNITVSEGGSDEETDDRLRGRGADAHNRISKAGGESSYRSLVLGYDPAIRAVAVIRPEPGFIDLYPLMADGDGSKPADTQYRADLLEYVEPVHSRPQGDEVTVKEAVAVVYDLTVDLVVDGNADDASTETELALSEVASATERQLGGYVSDLAFSCKLKSIAGVVDATLTFANLPDPQMANYEFAQLGNLTVNVVEL